MKLQLTENIYITNYDKLNVIIVKENINKKTGDTYLVTLSYHPDIRAAIKAGLRLETNCAKTNKSLKEILKKYEALISNLNNDGLQETS